jgi:hypothetical protein
MRSRLLTAALLVVALTACGSSGDSDGDGATSAAALTPTAAPTVPPASTPATEPAPWPVPADPMGLSQKAGLAGEPAEHLQYHVHAHLDVFVNGTRVEVPAGIGIDTTNPAVASFALNSWQQEWGLQSECATPCISPLHTHDPSGTIHTESASPEPHVLGQFFTQWGVTLDPSCVGGYCRPADAISLYVDGAPVTGDPDAIELADGREIAIVIGTPPPIIPSTFDASAAHRWPIPR